MTIQLLTVGIPVFNEETNIKKLIRGILAQKTIGFRIKEIIVSSDGSTDNTLRELSSIKDERLTVLSNPSRKGIARGLNQIIQKTNSDILVTLDGDIKITKRNFLSRLVRPILLKEADLTSSAIEEVIPESRIARILYTSMRLKTVLFGTFKGGNNIYNCHGLARAYSKRFYQNLHFPVSIGNDMYCYLEANIKGYKFVYVRQAKAFYKLPENWHDHKKQSERFFVTEQEMKKIFREQIVENETKIPLWVYIKASVRALRILVTNPVDSLLYLVIQLYLRLIPKKANASRQAWNMAVSSKSPN